MKPRTLQFMAAACAGRLRRGDAGAVVRRVGTDPRGAQAGDLFVALVGERFDGHDFLGEAVGRGVSAVMVEGRSGLEVPGVAGVIEVDHTRRALGRLAVAHRREFSLPVVAVGGSNGKTTTKELLGGVLGQRWRTLVNEASYNNDVGVPLTLLRLEEGHEAAVLEVGTNHPGELAPLLGMLEPRFGVLTCIGREHLEHFGDLEGVALEEGKVAEALPAGGTLFVNGDSPGMEGIVGRTRARVVRVGLGEGNVWRGTEVRVDPTGTTFRVVGPDRRYEGEYRLQLLGHHQVANALLALAVGVEMGLTPNELERGLLECPPARMRLQLWSAGGVMVLDDTYNANADSMRAALETLRELHCRARRVAVLGDMAELGAHSEAAHAEVGRCAAETGVDHLFAVGRYAGVMGEAARGAGLAGVTEVGEVEAAAGEVRGFVRPDDLVLLKASRATRLERVGQALKAAAGG